MNEVHDATGAYVLHALDPDEQAEFEAHLATCPTCRREVAELGETAAQLALLASTPAPATLEGAVLAAVRGVRVLPPEATEEPGPRRAAAAEPVEEEHVPARAAAPVPADELAVRRLRRRNRVLSAAVAAVTVVALALGAWVHGLVQQRQEQIATTTAETELYSAPDVQVVPAPLANGSRGAFVASRSLDRAMFSTGRLPDPGPGRTYQLWTLTGTPHDLGTVRPDNTLPGGTAVRRFLRGPIARTDMVAITIEQAGGSPTGRPDLTTLQVLVGLSH